MSRDRLILIPLLAALFVLGGCQSEGKLTGEVFVVTEGRANIEMGLVEVKGVKASALDQHLEERHSRSKKEVRALARKAAVLLDSLIVAQQKYEKRKAEYEEAQAEYEEATAMYRATLRSFNPSPQASSGDRVAVALEENIKLRSEPNFSSPTIGYMSGGDKGTVLSVEEKGVNKFYKIKTEGGLEGWIGYIGKLVEIKEKAVKIKNEKNRIKNESRKRYIRAEKEIENILKRVKSITKEVAKHRKQGYYYKNLPQAAESDETGSDGEYELSVEGGVPYYLIAQASRSTGLGEEQYYWMVKATVEGGEEKEVNLSNDNLDGMAKKGYALSERTLSTVRGIWNSSISLAKEGEKELDWEKLIYRTAFPQDTTDVPIPDDLDVPEEKLLSDR